MERIYLLLAPTTTTAMTTPTARKCYGPEHTDGNTYRETTQFSLGSKADSVGPT